MSALKCMDRLGRLKLAFPGRAEATAMLVRTPQGLGLPDADGPYFTNSAAVHGAVRPALAARTAFTSSAVTTAA